MNLARLIVVSALLVSPLISVAQDPISWTPLKDDGLHDPRSPALRELADPAESLAPLARVAPDRFIGNQVRWVHLIEQAALAPRTNVLPGTPMRVLDQDIYLDIGGSMAVVRFPHRAHTYWLDCSNCHDRIFKEKAGGNKISMLQILEGEQCGICHGAVAFPLTECGRCHSVPQVDFPALESKLGLRRVPGTKTAR